jgi:hypothetical protein
LTGWLVLSQYHTRWTELAVGLNAYSLRYDAGTLANDWQSTGIEAVTLKLAVCSAAQYMVQERPGLAWLRHAVLSLLRAAPSTCGGPAGLLYCMQGAQVMCAQLRDVAQRSCNCWEANHDIIQSVGATRSIKVGAIKLVPCAKQFPRLSTTDKVLCVRHAQGTYKMKPQTTISQCHN